MALQFKDYQRTELKTVGTCASNAGKGGAISLIESNFKNNSVRVKLIVKRADGHSCLVNCSTKVSAGLRDQSLTLSQVQAFPIVETIMEKVDEETAEVKKEAVHWVTLPSGNQVEEFAVNTEAVAEIETKTIKLDELVAW
jgi:hypothetical protein